MSNNAITTVDGIDIFRLASVLQTLMGRWVYLTTPLSSTSFDGDAYTVMGSLSQIDLSSVFGAPAGIKAVLCYAAVNSATVGARLYLQPKSTGSVTAVCRCQVASQWFDRMVTIPCDENGDIHYQVLGATTSVIIRIWGYCI